VSERGADPTLLIVDDDTGVLSALRRTLRREGYRILTAETAAQALHLLRDHEVDLILSDHKMPVMSGIQLFGEAARLRPTAAKVLITGWTEEVPKSELDALGVSALSASSAPRAGSA
jgi:DNA-binding NtrC family response regulator